MEMKGAFLHSVELRQPVFYIAPKALDSIDMVGAKGKFVVAMIDPQMLVEAQIDQPVVASPAVGMNYGFKTCLAANDGLQRGF